MVVTKLCLLLCVHVTVAVQCANNDHRGHPEPTPPASSLEGTHVAYAGLSSDGLDEQNGLVQEAGVEGGDGVESGTNTDDSSLASDEAALLAEAVRKVIENVNAIRELFEAGLPALLVNGEERSLHALFKALDLLENEVSNASAALQHPAGSPEREENISAAAKNLSISENMVRSYISGFLVYQPLRRRFEHMQSSLATIITILGKLAGD